jgi:hypothetical protein
VVEGIVLEGDSRCKNIETDVYGRAESGFQSIFSFSFEDRAGASTSRSDGFDLSRSACAFVSVSVSG